MIKPTTKTKCYISFKKHNKNSINYKLKKENIILVSLLTDMRANCIA